MIRTCSSKQLTITEFDWPFETTLDKHNRWVKLSQCVPWDKLAESYYQGLASDRGRPTKDARLVIGAVIIKHKPCLSDMETVQQIQENPYLQYFVGLPGYQQAAPFAPSLFVEIRKRMGAAVFEGFHRAIIDAHERKKPPKQSESAPQVPPQSAPSEQADAVKKSGSFHDETQAPQSVSQPVEPSHQGQLILDATVVEQAIRFPTDLSLLNEAREFSEKIIDTLCTNLSCDKNPEPIVRKPVRRIWLSPNKNVPVEKCCAEASNSNCSIFAVTWGI